MVPPDSDRISPVPPYSGFCYVIYNISPTGLSPSMVQLSSCVLLYYICPMSQSYNPQNAVTSWVWAVSRSLATTCGITVVFSSYAYLDVSVQRVRVSIHPIFNRIGCPIRKPPDQFAFADPRRLSQLVTSFFASESLGIPHTPLFTFFHK